MSFSSFFKQSFLLFLFILKTKVYKLYPSMLNPIKLKFKKEHKSTFKNKEYSVKNSSLLCGDIGIVAVAKGFLFYKEIASAKKVIAKDIKGVGIVFSRVRPNRPKTEKKKGMRMGKGKGAVGSWVVQVSAGMVLFEVFGLIKEKEIKETFKNSSIRLSLKTKIIYF
jgi:ribosomal protein L16